MKSLCCQCFTIRLSPEELWENYEHYVLNKGDYPDKNDHSKFIDIEITVPMLRYIGMSCKDPATGVIQPEPMHLYTCSHLKNKECSIYYTQKRPFMCTAFPRKNCHYKGCESTKCEYHGSCDWVWYNTVQKETLEKVTENECSEPKRNKTA
jgi:hypothetical protein